MGEFCKLREQGTKMYQFLLTICLLFYAFLMLSLFHVPFHKNKYIYVLEV